MKGTWSWMKQRCKRRVCGREMNEMRDERERGKWWAAGGVGRGVSWKILFL